MKTKRIISLVLALVMLFSLTCVNVFAITEGDAETITISATDVAAEKSSEPQTVIVNLYMDKDAEISNFGAKVNISDNDGIGVVFAGGATIFNDEMVSQINLPANGTTGGLTGSDDYAQHKVPRDEEVGGYILAEIPFTIPADAVGTVTVDFTEINAADWDEGSGYILSSTTATATINVSEPKVEGYTAQVTAPAEVTAGTDFVVNVGVGHDTDTTFHAAEIVLEYDAAALTLKDISETQNMKYTDANGVLTVENFDEEHTMGTGVYTFTFTANADKGNTETTVTLKSAKFLDKAAASVSNLIPATVIDPDEATVEIKEVVYKITTTEGSDITGLTYDTEVTKGEDLVITAANTNLWDYEITAKIGDTAVEVTGPVDGKFTIAAEDITGDIVLETSRTERTFTVQVIDDDENLVGLPAEAPKYNTDYIFTIPEDKLPTTTSEGYTYSATVTVNGADYEPLKDGLTYTIPGADVVGDIVITLHTEVESATPIPQVTVEVTGSTDVKVNGQDKVTVDEGTTVTLTLTKEPGYDYVVKVGTEDITEAIVESGTYDLTAEATITVSVEKTLITENLVQVYDYLTLDSQAGEKLWLVTFTPTLAEGKIPTYDGVEMFWSEADKGGYDAYCYLVKATTLTAENAAAKLNTTVAEAVEVDYSGEVNKTTIRDAADAQFVANMYNAMYGDIRSSGETGDNPTMAMFLSADVNNDKKVSVLDAEKIVKMILGRND